ncbi:Bug family tripartite tricarboxylate transporter substrate binding protein [Ottowia thiooxydans]|uniref:Bug family tripartite tricarboxylate transporter substrate binding protein n=1 Tax=Ottowia thiooxydans TaxID=219182 RepID=UPI0004218B43|nr:tripartite tricarboxylate transporter substrate binding protein [Ottowia thiooxydans]
MQMGHRAGWLIKTLAIAGSIFAQSAMAQSNYPSRPIQVIVPYAAGGTTDLAGRIVAKALGEQLNQTVVVENKVGAAGSVGVAQAVRSAPDGYTMAVSGVSSTMLHQLLGRKLPYDPQTDLNSVAYMGSSGMVVITRKDSNFKSLRQLIEHAKTNPGVVTFGSAGNASPGHLATEYIASMAKIKMTHVPYAGDSALMGDLMSGRIDIATVGIASVFSHMNAGSISALGLTSRERLASFPNVPTVAEAGLNGYEADIWNLLVLPKGTPAQIDAKLNATVNQLMADKGVREALLNIGFTARPMSLAEIRDFINVERVKWGAIIRDAKIKID